MLQFEGWIGHVREKHINIPNFTTGSTSEVGLRLSTAATVLEHRHTRLTDITGVVEGLLRVVLDLARAFDEDVLVHHDSLCVFFGKLNSLLIAAFFTVVRTGRKGNVDNDDASVADGRVFVCVLDVKVKSVVIMEDLSAQERSVQKGRCRARTHHA